MDIDQLLDPNRLASIWDAETRRVRMNDLAARRSEDESDSAPDTAITHDATVAQGLDIAAHGDEIPGDVAAPRPDAQGSLRALQDQIEILFAEGSDERRIVQAQLTPMREALAGAGPISAQQLDDLEDLLETFLVARNWAAEPGGKR